MGSLRFPFPPPPHPSTTTRLRFSPSTIACSVAVSAAIGAGISAGISISKNSSTNNLLNSLLSKFSSHSSSSPLWGSISLSDSSAAAAVVTESKTGASFPAALKESQGLLGIGLRRKSVFGLKNIDVYAFGVYADDNDVKNFVSEKYGTLSTNELKQKEVTQDLMESDVSVTVRLQIVYGKLSIRSVRNAFEESVGNRLKKFGGSDNKELLQKFTSQFSDEYKIPRGSIIDLSKDKGYVLRTTIDGKEVGSVQSQLLCRSILDLYIGDEPFDSKAKDEINLKLASVLTK